METTIWTDHQTQFQTSIPAIATLLIAYTEKYQSYCISIKNFSDDEANEE